MFGKKNQTSAPAILDSDALLFHVRMGNIDVVRQHFDRTLKGEQPAAAEWAHLQAALQRNDMPMMRLLVTWGAVPDATAITDLSDTEKTRLRIAGIDFKGTIEVPAGDLPLGTKLPTAPDKTPTVSAPRRMPTSLDMPHEWIDVLKAFQEVAKAPEAMIVGGALRDKHTKKPVSDVDIFLRMPNWPGQEQGILKRAFKKAGLQLHTQEERRIETYGGGVVVRQKLFTQQGHTSPFVYREIGLGVTSAWMAVAGNSKTNYNIIFVDSPMMDRLRRMAKEDPANDAPIKNFIGRLDIGLCQIAYRNGSHLVISPAYEKDYINKTLTLVNLQQVTYDHAQRVVKKFTDYTPDDKLAKIVEAEQAGRPSPRRGYNPYSFLPPG